MPRRPSASSSTTIARRVTSGHSRDGRAKRKPDQDRETASVAFGEAELGSLAVKLGQTCGRVGEADSVVESFNVFETRPIVVDAEGEPTVLTLGDDGDRPPALAR